MEPEGGIIILLLNILSESEPVEVFWYMATCGCSMILREQGGDYQKSPRYCGCLAGLLRTSWQWRVYSGWLSSWRRSSSKKVKDGTNRIMDKDGSCFGNLDRALAAWLCMPERYWIWQSYPINRAKYVCCSDVWITWVSNSLRLRWLVIMAKRWPRRYWLHLFTFVVIANSPHTYIKARRSFGMKGLRKKERGCPCWDRTAPIPTLKSSISIMKGSWKLGKARTGAVDRACLSYLKAI